MSTCRKQRHYFWYRPITVAICVICFLSAAALAEQTLSGEAFERLKRDVQAELDARHKAAQVTDELFPGATAAFVLGDGCSAGLATGFADMEEKTTMSIGARMPAGSIGKTYVAAVALSLVADGTLDLDGKIARWLGGEPWFDRLANRNSIILRHLLNHSSGIIDHVFDQDSGFQHYFKEQLRRTNTERSMDPREFVQFILDRKPLFPVGLFSRAWNSRRDADQCR